jgi:hypothetical protein
MSWRWVYLLFSGGTLRDVLQSRARRRRLWRDAAAACGLTVVGTSVWPRRLKLAARAGPIEVRIEGTQQNIGTRIVVMVPGPPGFGNVKIRREVGEQGAREIEIGDEVFDRTFSIEGPMRLVCVLLDAKARRLLLRLSAKNRVEIAGGELRAEMFDREVPAVLRLVLNLGRRFSKRTDVVRCLAENAHQDPKPGVRLRNLLLLVHECARGPWTIKALRTAGSDPSPQIRLQAGMELGAEGRDILVALAKGKTDDDCSAQAIRILGRELPFEHTTAILDRALQARRIQTACACLETLGSSGNAGAVATLAEVLAQEEGELATTAAQGLGDTGSAAAEQPLILALQREQADLRITATSALARVGSAAAVLPLEEAAERASRDDGFRRTARQAIAEIQSRLPGAAHGQLTLAGAEGGQLSLATETAGQLSLPAEEAGQLSLSEDEEEVQPPSGEAAQ